LVERLKLISPEFAQWWPRHDILPLTERSVEYSHPLAGRMLVDAITLSVGDNPEMRVIFFLPVAEANSIGKMRKVIMGFRNDASSRPSGAQGSNRPKYRHHQTAIRWWPSAIELRLADARGSE
jgi:MmyB-like transcription regulator ligand binding domain